MDLEQLAIEVFGKLESLAIQGFELGKEMVMKEIVFQTWLYQFLFWLGIVFLILGTGYFIFLTLSKTQEWFNWDRDDDIVDRGLWFAGCFLFGGLLIIGIIMIPCALVELKHIEFNPVFYTLKAML